MDVFLPAFIVAAVAVGLVKFVQHRRRLTRERYDAMFEDIIAQLRKPK